MKIVMSIANIELFLPVNDELESLKLGPFDDISR